nr:hypothetical protein [Dyella soli]
MAAALVDRGVWTQEQAATALAGIDAEPEEGGTLAPAFSAQRDSLELRGTLVSHGIDESTAGFFGEMFRKALANPPDEATKSAALAATVDYFRAEWGENTDTMNALAKSELALLTQSYPKLPELLEVSGLGNHPLIVRRLAQQGLDRAAKRKLGIG